MTDFLNNNNNNNNNNMDMVMEKTMMEKTPLAHQQQVLMMQSEDDVDGNGDGMMVMCCMCSAPISPNPSNMCAQCLRTQVDITEGIPTRLTIHECRGCNRWLRPGWVTCGLESKELLAICLKRITGLTKVKLIDASWIWTEPHSKRLKVKLIIQKEVMNNAILQQSLVVEYVVRNQQCPSCQAEYCNGSWKALIQVRQRVDHKRTFYYLEQLILKHQAHTQCVQIQQFRDGMDFFYLEKSHAYRFMDFLQTVIPCRIKNSKKLISADNHSNTYNFKYTSYVEIVPVCKDDLCHLSIKLANNLSNITRLTLINRVSSMIHIVDPVTGQKEDIDIEKFSKNEFKPLLGTNNLQVFVVLDVEAVLPRKTLFGKAAKQGKHRLAEVTVARADDFGKNDQQHTVVTHLGSLLQCGDLCTGYDLTSANISSDQDESVRNTKDLPDIVLVRKLYGSKASKKRWWKLSQLEYDEQEKLRGKDQEKADQDYEEFLQQLEGDKDMRKGVRIYRDEFNTATNESKAMATGENDNENENNSVVSEHEADEEEIRLDELLDGIQINDADADPEDAQVFDATDYATEEYKDFNADLNVPEVKNETKYSFL